MSPVDTAPRRERRATVRGRFDLARDLLYRGLRAIAARANHFYTAVGIYLVAGLLLAIIGSWGFIELAQHVRGGGTQAIDDAALRWMAAHRITWLERTLLAVTALGNGLVVLTIVVVAALFLNATEHRFSAFLLLVATGGGILLNNLLKLAFSRERPQIFEWITTVSSSSFPSGHAMSSTIVYTTVAYLVARLEPRRWLRVMTMLTAFILIALIGMSRIYLGVHYPSDVVGGVIVGLAWAGICLVGLEAMRVFALRYRPQVLEHERDLSKLERDQRGLPT